MTGSADRPGLTSPEVGAQHAAPLGRVGSAPDGLVAAKKAPRKTPRRGAGLGEAGQKEAGSAASADRSELSRSQSGGRAELAPARPAQVTRGGRRFEQLRDHLLSEPFDEVLVETPSVRARRGAPRPKKCDVRPDSTALEVLERLAQLRSAPVLARAYLVRAALDEALEDQAPLAYRSALGELYQESVALLYAALQEIDLFDLEELEWQVQGRSPGRFSRRGPVQPHAAVDSLRLNCPA